MDKDQTLFAHQIQAALLTIRPCEISRPINFSLQPVGISVAIQDN